MSLQVEINPNLSSVDASEWDALCGEHDPFVEHAFLNALEQSGSVGPGTGWSPCHVLVREEGHLVGALPLYAKEHSYGEYIFDWSWANGSHQMGIPYYPKLVSAVPFTPATGRRFLVASTRPSTPIVNALLKGVSSVASAIDASSAHVLFHTAEEQSALKSAGFLLRRTFQFHWENQGYESFDAYLASFRASERRKVRKERREAAASKLTLCTYRGAELADPQWESLYRFYRDTTSRKGAIPYLNEGFFDLLRGELKKRVLVMMAEDAGRPVAGALFFHKGAHLYGRYWGCIEDYDKLHFELCYYRPLAHCIDSQWARFEAGAQGVHKLKRGFLPAFTYSAHWIADHRLGQGIEGFLRQEDQAICREMDALRQHSPFRRG